ncbi:MAG: hypothetical protein ABI156_03790 [Caldimonas sp.]
MSKNLVARIPMLNRWSPRLANRWIDEPAERAVGLDSKFGFELGDGFPRPDETGSAFDPGLSFRYRRSGGLGHIYDIELKDCDYEVRLDGNVLRSGSFPTPVSSETRITRKTFIELEIEYLIGMSEE